MVDLADVDASGEGVGADEDVDRAAAELVQRLVPFLSYLVGIKFQKDDEIIKYGRLISGGLGQISKRQDKNKTKIQH